jgi:urease accessory protein
MSVAAVDGDLIGQPPTDAMQRSNGEVRLVLKQGCPGSVLERLFESGCLRLRIPRNGSGSVPEAVLINSAGGVTGGDRLKFSAHWRPGTTGCIATQAAEKIYRAKSGKALVTNALIVESGACAEWLPQETILFNGAALDRRLDIQLSKGARLLAHESIVFGRTAMGEEVISGSIHDRWTIRRDGRLIYADTFRLEGSIAAQLAAGPVAAGARACGTILLVSDEVPGGILTAVREALADSPARAAASAWNGILSIRFLAEDGEVLRRAVSGVLSVLRNGTQLPGMWRC